MKNVSIETISKRFNLNVLTNKILLEKKLSNEDLHRPGIEFTGYYKLFPKDRIHILGKQEFSYLLSLPEEKRQKRIKGYIKQNPPCVIITRGQNELNETFISLCNEYNVPLLQTNEKTTKFISKLNNFLEKELSKEIGVHGVCINVFGVGILLRGASGVGKSELALSLVEKGHRLISDDLVVLKQIGPEALIATHNNNNRDFLALRGVGLVDIARLYGSGAIQEETKINLDILISPWDENKVYDAMGIDIKKVNYLDIEVEHLEIPIRPGRDLATLIEVAAKNWRLEQNGYNALDEFQKRLTGQ